jgi:hypothetical protein
LGDRGSENHFFCPKQRRLLAERDHGPLAEEAQAGLKQAKTSPKREYSSNGGLPKEQKLAAAD